MKTDSAKQKKYYPLFYEFSNSCVLILLFVFSLTFFTLLYYCIYYMHARVKGKLQNEERNAKKRKMDEINGEKGRKIRKVRRDINGEQFSVVISKSDRNIQFENIYNQNIFQKYFMNQSRRFTRRAASGFSNNKDQESKNRDDIQLRTKVNQAMQGKHFGKALSLLKSGSSKSHWVACLRARCLFGQGSLPRALNAVRKFIITEHNGCQGCFQLLLNIIDKNRPEINKFNNDIQICLTYEKLPPKLRARFEDLKLELAKVEKRPQTTNRQFQQLASYYENKGLIFKKVEIVEVTSQYRVARAKSTIKPNEIIIYVPEQQMITLEMAKTLPQVSKIAQEESRLKSPKHTMLSVFLLIHMNKGHDSPYFNYIQCLPKKLENFPIYYSEQLLEELEGTYFLSILKRKKIDIEEDFEQIMLIAPQFRPQITYEKFVWSRMIVSSRIFGVIINGRKTDALVPIADMLNHKAPRLTSWFFSDQKQGFIVQNANQLIPKGQQIFDSYGSKCNSRFLLNYGFTMPENSFNEVMIMLKKHKKSKIIPPNIKLSTCINSDEFRIILAYYRQIIYELNNPQAIDKDQLRSKASTFISNESECEVWRMMQQTMKEQLGEYKTTIKKDEKILRSSDQLSFNLRNCIEIRLGEKRILQFYIKMSKKMIQYFISKRKPTDVRQYEIYMRDILNQGSSGQ